MRKRVPGWLVQCNDGRIGRVYVDDLLSQNKLKVYLLPSVFTPPLTGKFPSEVIDTLITTIKMEMAKHKGRAELELRLHGSTDGYLNFFYHID